MRLGTSGRCTCARTQIRAKSSPPHPCCLEKRSERPIFHVDECKGTYCYSTVQQYHTPSATHMCARKRSSPSSTDDHPSIYFVIERSISPIPPLACTQAVIYLCIHSYIFFIDIFTFNAMYLCTPSNCFNCFVYLFFRTS